MFLLLNYMILYMNKISFFVKIETFTSFYYPIIK